MFRMWCVGHTRPLPYHAHKTSTIPCTQDLYHTAPCTHQPTNGMHRDFPCGCTRFHLVTLVLLCTCCSALLLCALLHLANDLRASLPHCTTHPHPAQPNFKSSPPNRYTCGRPAENAVDTEQGLCHAVSTDGREWTKPLVGHGNNSGTNRLVTEAFDSALVWQDYTQPVGSPRRWVMSSVPKSLNFSHLRIMQSPDGLNWTVAVKESGLVFFGSLSLSLA